MVMRRSKRRIPIDVGRGRRRTWKENGGKADFFYVSTESEARDIDEVYGMKGTGDVWVREHGQRGHDATYREDGVHTYFFGSGRKYRENYDRIFKKAQRGEEPEV
jgi:hypothetical protein